MTPSINCYTIIKHYEQCRLKAFKPTPNDRWTIGWGRSYGVKPGDVITQEEADRLLEVDVGKAVRSVIDCIGSSPTTQNQFDALVSFEYNTGGLAHSTLLKHHLNEAYEAAAAQFQLWIYQGKDRLKGLIRRRAVEASLYMFPDTDTIWVLRDKDPR